MSARRMFPMLSTEDLERAVEFYGKLLGGCPILVEPTDQPWGERVAYVSEPDGNLVMLTRA